MSESLNSSDQEPPLRPELEGIIPKVAKLKYWAEVMSGNVCNGFPSESQELKYTRGVHALWQEATGNTDPAGFEADLVALNETIVTMGGAQAVCDAFTAPRK